MDDDMTLIREALDRVQDSHVRLWDALQEIAAGEVQSPPMDINEAIYIASRALGLLDESPPAA